MNELMVGLTRRAQVRFECAASDKIDDGPMFVALLQMRELQIGQFTAPESSTKLDVMARALPSSTGPAS